MKGVSQSSRSPSQSSSLSLVFCSFKDQFSLEARGETVKDSRMIASKTKVALGLTLFASQKVLFYMVRIFPCRFPAASLFIKNSNNFQFGPYSSKNT